MNVESILLGNPLGKRVLLPLVVLAFLSIVIIPVSAQESSEPVKSQAGQPAKAPVTEPAKAPVTEPAKTQVTEPARAVNEPTNEPKTEASEAAKAQAAAAVRVRIERARALAAAHRLQDASRELESLRSMAADEVVRNVTSVMLMSIYLEEGNYARAEALLEETFRARATQKESSIRTYFVLAGQAVNGARAHISRYRNFGINVTDAGLPAEALADLDRMRSLLERMIAQARELTKDESKAYDSLALLEDVLGVRLSLAREGEDSDRWSNEYTEARQGLSASQKQVASLGGMPSISLSDPRSPAAGKAVASPAQTQTPKTPQDKATAEPGKGGSQPINLADPNTLSVGSLNHWATKRVVPVYPPVAKTSGVAGVVKVFLTTDTDGRVITIVSSEGPMVLKQAAESAARQWRFQPAIVADKRFGLSGFLEFNFTP